MGLTFAKLIEYFGIIELKKALRDINEPLVGTRQELAKRVYTRWLTYNRKVEDVLDFLDDDMLATICADYNLGDDGGRETLKRRIKRNLNSNNSKPTEKTTSEKPINIQEKNYKKNNKPNTSNLNKKFFGFLIISVLICVIFGISIFLTYSGYFDPRYSTVIPLEKEYLLVYSDNPGPTVLKPNETLIVHGGLGYYEISGKLILTTSSLSVQNPINVRIELFPTLNDGDKEWNFLPENHFAYFPKAKWFGDYSKDAEIANPVIINLTKSNNPPLISGEGTLLYQKDDSYPFFILDPIELPKIASQFKRDISLEYKIPTGLNWYNVTKNNDNENQIVIQPVDSLNQLNSNRLTLIAIFVTIIVSVPSILFFFYKKHPV